MKSGAFDDINNMENVDDAIYLYSSILNLTAPIKIIHNRNSCGSYISREIKGLMEERDDQKQEEHKNSISIKD